MKKYYYVVLACFSLLTIQAQNTRSGFYNLPLTEGNGTPPPGIVEQSDTGGNSPSGYERYTSEGLVLTNKRVAHSAFAIDNLEIDLREGVTIEFEYAMATLNQPAYGKGEGMALFLYDAEERLDLGYGFEALGYAYNEANGVIGRKSSLKGAYLAVGFDIGGGFKNFFETNEHRREGISPARFQAAGYYQNDFGRYQRNHITLRGGHANYYIAAGYNGNPVLYTKYFGGASVSAGELSMASLDYRTGEYHFDHNTDGDSFDVGNGGTQANPNFQKIIVELEPASDGEALYITVKAKEDRSEITLIDKFKYESSFKTYDKANNLYDFRAPIPERVKVGFTASTGNFTQQKTIIRNVKVSIPNALILEDVQADMCVSDSGGSRGAEITIPLFEDLDFSVNASSFQFVNSSGNEVGSSYTQSNVGEWSYSSSREEVTLTLDNAYFEPGDVAEVHYVVEARDGTKSQQATLRVSGVSCGAVANPQIRVKDQNQATP
ncbi:hypothetical protein [Myroides sp. DW712]|uniref:hypothetical protein n=1 Tax=Myroides sp. DW712 TaxID=3389800 RepID=UPI00397D1743